MNSFTPTHTDARRFADPNFTPRPTHWMPVPLERVDLRIGGTFAFPQNMSMKQRLSFLVDSDDEDDVSALVSSKKENKKPKTKKRGASKKKGASKKTSADLSSDDESSLEKQTKKQKTTVVNIKNKEVSKNQHDAAVDRWSGPTSKLRKQQEMKREINHQVGQYYLESVEDEDCIDIEKYSITQGGVTYHGFKMLDIDETIGELEIQDIMSFKDKDGNEISDKEKRTRLLDALTNLLHFFEHKGRLNGSRYTGTDGNKIDDYGSIEYAFVHESFTTEKVQDIVQGNNEKNPNWQVGKNLLQDGQVPAEEQVIHPMSERRIRSQRVIKEKGKKDRIGYTYYCRCGDCNKAAQGGKEGFCDYHFKIHGTKKAKKAAKKKAPAKKKAATKKT